MSKRYALIIISHFKPAWHSLSEEEQVGFAMRVRRAAEAAEVQAVVGYALTTQGSTLEIWEADHKARLNEFKHKLDALGYKKYYDEVLIQGERAADWIQNSLLKKEHDAESSG
jgi:hypothetical protein